MKLELTRIGNSRGIRIPKPLIEQCGLGDVVEVRVTPGGLVLAPHRRLREGWKESFSESPPYKDEHLFDHAASNAFDAEDWKW
jgi:antitoxin MazE